MRTLVIQSYRSVDVPAWIARCMLSVSAWARARGYDYRLAGDDSFALCGEAYLQAAQGNIRSITNLSRLLLIREALAGDYDRAIWLDADIFIFAPTQLDFDDVERYAFARETWIGHVENESYFAYWGVNNSVAVFNRHEPDLEFIIRSIYHIAEHRPLRSNYQVGGDLIKGLRSSLAFEVTSRSAMFSPTVVLALAEEHIALLRAQARFHQEPVYAANLCASENYDPAVTGVEISRAMDRLERSRGKVVNRWLAEGPLQAHIYPGSTVFNVSPGEGSQSACESLTPARTPPTA